MAIADGAADGYNTTVSGSSLSWTNVVAGSDIEMTAEIWYADYLTVTTFTCNGVAMTLKGSVHDTTNSRNTDLYRVSNPGTGTLTLSVSFSGGTGPIVGLSHYYTGVLGIAPETGSAAWASIGSPFHLSVPITTTIDNCWIVAGGAGTSSSLTPDGDTTLHQHAGVSLWILSSASARTPPGSFTVGVTASGAWSAGYTAYVLSPTALGNNALFMMT